MKTYRTLYPQLCSYQNLELAFLKARKRKTAKEYVIEFESELQRNLEQLKYELESSSYSPRALTAFIVRDPKTRKINASDFRDRVVYHAICNIIAPIFEKSFIHDSFANQKNKGTHDAIKRAEKFIGKIKLQRAGGGGAATQNSRPECIGYALKADIRHYFDTVDHRILLSIIGRKIKDPNLIWLIKLILDNHKTEAQGKGMPLGNMTSQFFANVYLDELDQYVKHKMRVKYYLRYVDDFVIFHRDKPTLERWKIEIDAFLKKNLKIELHPEKSRIIEIDKGITMLGFRIFPNNRLIKKSNARRIWKRLDAFKRRYDNGTMSQNQIANSIEGWLAYSKFANTYNLRKKVVLRAGKILFQEETLL